MCGFCYLPTLCALAPLDPQPLKTRRREILVYLDCACEGRPIARLTCSLLQMHYRITATPGCALPFVDTLTRPDSLARRPSLSALLLERLGSRASLPGAPAARQEA